MTLDDTPVPDPEVAAKPTRRQFSASYRLRILEEAGRDPRDAKLRALEAKVAHLEKELHTAHTILEVQGKLAGLLGFSLKDGKDC
mgnify:CR=1 FL=1